MNDMNADKETRHQQNLDILDLHYTEFYFDKSQYFLSFFDNSEEKDKMLKVYQKIIINNKENFFLVNSLKEIEDFIEPFKKSQELNQTFKKYTLIIDVMDIPEKNMMVNYLLSNFWILKNKNPVKIHYIGNFGDITGVNSLVPSDLWQFRTQTFFYENNELSSILLKQKIEEIIPEQSNTGKKHKI